MLNKKKKSYDSKNAELNTLVKNLGTTPSIKEIELKRKNNISFRRQITFNWF